MRASTVVTLDLYLPEAPPHDQRRDRRQRHLRDGQYEQYQRRHCRRAGTLRV